MDAILLTRDQFREGVFARDSHKCIICGETKGLDAHHILERRLWDESQGYYLDNGATLCSKHHIEAEMTTLSCDEIREKIGIKTPLLPPQYYKDTKYDKWGNIILDSGYRLKGDLFGDESVQKILSQGNVLGLFKPYVKYPRTYHLPWSPGFNSDDRVMESTSCFEGKEVVVTVKLDGENCSMYQDHIHARSLDSNNHPSRTWVKNYHSQICGDIPDGWRVCGENLYAKHSIEYNNLPTYFLVFSIWNDKNMCLSWENTKEWCELMGLQMVPVIYEGIWDEDKIKTLYKETHGGDPMEGYVVRVKESFFYKDFKICMGKYVRKNHVTTHGHWMRSRLTLNGIKK